MSSAKEMRTFLLRPVQRTDLQAFFQHQQDAAARSQAAFTSKDPTDEGAFLAHWERILQDDTVKKSTILLDNTVIGHIASWLQDEKRHVTYWLDRDYWGRGLATRALTMFITETPERPLYASAAMDNLASLKVLERCGFKVIGQEKAFANARGEEIEEVFLELVE